MIKEIVNFMKLLPDEFKTVGSQPKEGLHIVLNQKVDTNQVMSIDLNDFQYEMYAKKDEEISSFLEECKLRHQNAWCIDTNKCFDLPIKAIHSCSPFVVAFKREHLRGGGKYTANQTGKKRQLYERFADYFEKAFQLFDQEKDQSKYEVFKHFFTGDQFSLLLDKIEERLDEERNVLQEKQEELKELTKNTKDSQVKEQVKLELKEIEKKLTKVRKLGDGEYVIFYLNEPIEMYEEAHKKYLDDRLFNTDKYNTVPDDEGLIYGTSNFMNGFNANMPFLMHQSASFDITGRISNVEARLLHEFKGLLPNKTLPNPLPIFIYEEELNGHLVELMRESNYKFGYQEIVKSITEYHKKDIGNYYLLFWQNTKDGLVFRDFDYVSTFEYKFSASSKDALVIDNLFEVQDEKKRREKIIINDIFHLENTVFKPLLGNKFHKLDYFSDLTTDGYESLVNTFQSYSKYRKTVYDFVYKSQRHLIDYHIFHEMVFNGIKDNIKNNYTKGVREKLNIWYSIQHYFNQKNKAYMGDRLKDYQEFVTELISETGLQRETNDAYFAFTAGMVINYIINKSRSADASFQLLEPYLQQVRCSEFKKAIANDFARYKHERFSRNFERAAAFVLSYETESDLKKLLPEILSGVFANNQLYSSTKK
ncbi:hypothetical protein [Myroides sp. WP-1]|uniref:hypothetical protein n=1 Tax=Myroides sp. WP-1 TaxID=2759944 RepID=UPI0015F8F58B|nr:hypothetical protein [Myroides sp. WP-1]MBB1139707.1 hypothetical protein [Myroides sp. WP-1]